MLVVFVFLCYCSQFEIAALPDRYRQADTSFIAKCLPTPNSQSWDSGCADVPTRCAALGESVHFPVTRGIAEAPSQHCVAAALLGTSSSWAKQEFPEIMVQSEQKTTANRAAPWMSLMVLCSFWHLQGLLCYPVNERAEPAWGWDPFVLCAGLRSCISQSHA